MNVNVSLSKGWFLLNITWIDSGYFYLTLFLYNYKLKQVIYKDNTYIYTYSQTDINKVNSKKYFIKDSYQFKIRLGPFTNFKIHRLL